MKLKSRSLRLLSLLFVFALVFSSSAMQALAAPDSNNHKRIITTADLKFIKMSDVPAGVTPIRVRDIEEAVQYLNTHLNTSKNTNNDDSLESIGLNLKATAALDSSNAYATQATANQTGTLRKSVSIGIPNLTIQSSFTYTTITSGTMAGQKRFTSGTGVSSYLTGLALGDTWDQTYSRQSLLDAGRTLGTTVGGVHTVYVISKVSGVVLYSEYEQYYKEFYYTEIK